MIKTWALLLSALLPYWVNVSGAQNSTLFGGNSLARECYERSRTAIQTRAANRLDLEACDRAIRDAGLSKEYLVATYVNRGIIHAAKGDLPSAAKDYNTALSMSNDTGEAYLNRGNLWFTVQKFPQALKDYDKALKYGIKEPHVAYLNRGIVLEKLGDKQAAEQSYLSALQSVSDWPPAQQRLNRLRKTQQ